MMISIFENRFDFDLILDGLLFDFIKLIINLSNHQINHQIHQIMVDYGFFG